MPQTDPEIILHNYPQSPVAEKVRVAFGIKKLAWRDVESPRLAPKPNLTKLTGGYRRTPVMQIGADIYCDSQCIIRELDRRFARHPLVPSSDAGLLWLLSRWTDGALFDLGVKIVLGAAGDGLDPAFAADRGRLYFGPDWAAGLSAANANLPHLAAQMRVPMSWVEQQLADGRAFLTGVNPIAADAQLYYVVWFLRGRWQSGPTFLSEFPNLEGWEARMLAIGHGSAQAMTPQEALNVAAASTPLEISASDPRDPQGLAPGAQVSVSPDLDGGEQAVTGQVVAVTAETLTLLRTDPDVGALHVHFPRSGYRIERLD